MGSFKESLPSKKDWKRGDTQIGLYYRGPEGQKIYITVNAASDVEIADCAKLILTMMQAAAKRNKLSFSKDV